MNNNTAAQIEARNDHAAARFAPFDKLAQETAKAFPAACILIARYDSPGWIGVIVTMAPEADADFATRLEHAGYEYDCDMTANGRARFTVGA